MLEGIKERQALPRPGVFVIREGAGVGGGFDPIDGDRGMIKAVFTDVDGVLTDGGYYYTKDGLEMKKFNTRDAAAVKRLQAEGVLVFVVTSADDEITKRRMADMCVDEAVYGRADKLEAVKEICEKHGLALADEVVYIGDDFMDVAALEAAAIGFSPDEAILSVEEVSVSTYRCGGEGVLSEVADGILLSLADKKTQYSKLGNVLYIDRGAT